MIKKPSSGELGRYEAATVKSSLWGACRCLRLPSIALPVPAVAIRVRVTCDPTPGRPLLQGALADKNYRATKCSGCYQFGSKTLCAKDKLPSYSVGSDIPQERGMGSSAAVAVALVRALADCMGLA